MTIDGAPGPEAGASPDAPAGEETASLVRPAESHETEAIMAGLAAWGKGVAGRVLGSRELWIDKDIVRLVAPARLPAEVAQDAVPGLAIGRLEEGAFILGLQGAVLAAPALERGEVTAAGKGAEAWLYGRPLLASSVVNYDGRLRPGDACIVTNERHEALGIGTVVGTFKGNAEVVHPVHELGSYLRDEDA